MDAVERIVWNGQPLCYIVRGQLPDRTVFVTPPEFPLQVGYIVYGAEQVIPRHTHRPVERSIVGTSEVLVVQKGHCELEVYGGDRHLVAIRELREGDVMIMVSGGHGFRMREDTVLLEIKQGPYPGVDEKERF